jgi:hypothetical protein
METVETPLDLYQYYCAYYAYQDAVTVYSTIYRTMISYEDRDMKNQP